MFFKGAVFPLEEPEHWALKYGLKVDARNCPECGAVVWLTIPFAMKEGVRGLVAPPCEICGNENSPLIVTRIKEK